ncbi:helix-turn-helix domain-containing protein [Paenibacillus camerounensis]|uniref:helix-turn-helix domain-containing protein n=1 Tax=Paenibacillus camerounensis TaxID=1243663 RepID=UPI0005A6A1A6|nr:helix-turn-helix domain-containing protein [Paenibacillus camerounensis]
MYNLAELYYPITARPDSAGELMPCKGLQPYIRCYWGSMGECGAAPGEQSAMPDKLSGQQPAREIIIPDTCMDIILEWDTDTGASGGVFCGINDKPFQVDGAGPSASRLRFAIRFHFWAVHLFADEPLNAVLNYHGGVERYFSFFRRELEEQLASAGSMAERIAVAERVLLRRLERARASHSGLMNAVHDILRAKGVIAVSSLGSSSGLSSRQLERLFRETTGVSPKQVADLVRFQNVWRNLYRPSPQIRDVQDLVYAYGYSHQSHFNNSFKRFAGQTPREALAYARR